jgi:hypothetical protein
MIKKLKQHKHNGGCNMCISKFLYSGTDLSIHIACFFGLLAYGPKDKVSLADATNYHSMALLSVLYLKEYSMKLI